MKGSPMSPRHANLPDRPGRMVDVGGYRVHVRSAGDGGPTAVLDSGLGGNSCLWANALPELAALCAVCAIDRAGYAWSDPAPPTRPRDSASLVDEQRSALRALGIPPPFVLVGHSFGAINTLVWARKHPDEVAGLVLVEPSHPEMWTRVDGIPDAASMALGYRVMTALAGWGVMRLAGPPLMRKAIGLAKGDLPVSELHAFEAFARRRQGYAAALREAEHGDESFAAATTQAGELGDLPLALLSADAWTTGRSSAMKEGMRALRAEMLTWSARSTERVVEGTGHGNLPVRAPAAVADALAWVLGHARE